MGIALFIGIALCTFGLLIWIIFLLTEVLSNARSDAKDWKYGPNSYRKVSSPKYENKYRGINAYVYHWAWKAKVNKINKPKIDRVALNKEKFLKEVAPVADSVYADKKKARARKTG